MNIFSNNIKSPVNKWEKKGKELLSDKCDITKNDFYYEFIYI